MQIPILGICIFIFSAGKERDTYRLSSRFVLDIVLFNNECPCQTILFLLYAEDLFSMASKGHFPVARSRLLVLYVCIFVMEKNEQETIHLFSDIGTFKSVVCSVYYKLR